MGWLQAAAKAETYAIDEEVIVGQARLRGRAPVPGSRGLSNSPMYGNAGTAQPDSRRCLEHISRAGKCLPYDPTVPMELSTVPRDWPERENHTTNRIIIGSQGEHGTTAGMMPLGTEGPERRKVSKIPIDIQSEMRLVRVGSWKTQGERKEEQRT